MVKDTVYFFSDAHLGLHYGNHKVRESRCISFLHSIKENASHLFIVGDLFDFWIEYKHAIRPIYFPILHALKQCVDNGIEIHYLAGNHDFAISSFLEDTIGMKIHLKDMSIILQNKNIYLRHGDGILKEDWLYRLWSRVLRNPVNQRIFKLLHPNIAIPLASFCSGTSRHYNLNKFTEEKIMRYLQQAQLYLSNGYDIVIMAHTHFPALYTIKEKIYCNTGEWMHRYSFAQLRNSSLRLCTYSPDQPSTDIKPQDVK